jgi:beta-alanine--pyruvate transaminase
MGAVLVQPHIHDAFMHGPDGVELFHGYTYSGHPVACAAGLASLAAFRDEGVLDNARSLASYWEDAVHSLRQAPHVIDIRNMGIAAAIELAPLEGRPGARAFDIFRRAFEEGVLIRVTGDTIALSPPLILQKSHIDELIGKLGDLLRSTGTTG